MESKLTSRVEFRAILKDLLGCIRKHLDKPGLVPLTPEEIHFWVHEITVDDVRIVLAEIDSERNRAA